MFRTGLCPPSRGAILLAGPRRHYLPFPLPITLCVHLVNQARYCIHDAKSARLIPLPPGLSAWLPSITSFGPVLLPCPGPGPGKERQRTEEGDTSTGLYRVGGGHRGLSSRRKVPGLNYPPSGGAAFDLGYRDARGKVGEKRAAANHVTPKGGKFSDGYCYGEQKKTGSRLWHLVLNLLSLRPSIIVQDIDVTVVDRENKNEKEKRGKRK